MKKSLRTWGYSALMLGMWLPIIASTCATKEKLFMHGDNKEAAPPEPEMKERTELVQSDTPYPAKLAPVLRAVASDLQAIDSATRGADGQGGILTKAIQDDFGQTQKMLKDFDQFLQGLTPGGARLTTTQIIQIRTRVEENPLLAWRAFEELRNPAKINISNLYDTEAIKGICNVLSEVIHSAESCDDKLVGFLKKIFNDKVVASPSYLRDVAQEICILNTVYQMIKKNPNADINVIQNLQKQEVGSLNETLKTLRVGPDLANVVVALVGTLAGSRRAAANMVYERNLRDKIDIIAKIFACYPLSDQSITLMEAVIKNTSFDRSTKAELVKALGSSLVEPNTTLSKKVLDQRLVRLFSILNDGMNGKLGAEVVEDATMALITVAQQAKADKSPIQFYVAKNKLTSVVDIYDRDVSLCCKMAFSEILGHYLASEKEEKAAAAIVKPMVTQVEKDECDEKVANAIVSALTHAKATQPDNTAICSTIDKALASAKKIIEDRKKEQEKKHVEYIRQNTLPRLLKTKGLSEEVIKGVIANTTNCSTVDGLINQLKSELEGKLSKEKIESITSASLMPAEKCTII